MRPDLLYVQLLKAVKGNPDLQVIEGNEAGRTLIVTTTPGAAYQYYLDVKIEAGYLASSFLAVAKSEKTSKEVVELAATNIHDMLGSITRSTSR